MHVFLLDKMKITKLTLPNNIEGVYSMEYKPTDSPIKKTVNIEAIDGKWVLKSNGEVNALQDGLVFSAVTLTEYNYCPLKIIGSTEEVGIFCVPSIENNYSKFTVNTDAITIGNTAQSSICYQNSFIQENHANITKEEGTWYISCPADNDKCTIYLNNRRITKNKLKTGDIIFIYGLKIVWLTSFMAVYSPSGKVTVNSIILPNFIDEGLDNSKVKPISDEEAAVELYKPNDYFFHTIRTKSSIEEKDISFDPPPANQVLEELPFILSMGSSLTMGASAFISGYSILMNKNDKPLSALLPSIVMCGSLVLGSLILPRITQAYQKRRAKKKEKYRQKKYKEYIQKKVNEIEAIIVNQTKILQENNPSLSECSRIVSSASENKWSREIKDEDFLSIRIGTGKVPAKIKVTGLENRFKLEEDNLEQLVAEVSNKEYFLENVPIPFSFIDNRVSAIICDVSYDQDYINGLILQFATFHSAGDLKLVFLLNDPNIENWNYAKFLPHSLSSTKTTRFFASNLNDIKTICSFLEDEFNRRYDNYKKPDTEETKEIHRDGIYKNFESYYMIITNDYLSIKNIPIIEKIMNAKENFGFSLLICENSIKRLPNQCEVFLQIMDPESYIISKNLNKQTKFKAEYDSNISMRNICSQLANIPLLTAGTLAALPTSLNFLEMYGVSKIEQLNIAKRWSENNPTESLRAQIGVHTNGDAFYLDLHEKFHGPHGLVAGSTGSGKSEWIITYLLSLALNYHPDEVQFVLIDYKGGGLAGAFENRQKGYKIPHLVGTITNLDVSEMNRTLVSINSELKRRQKRFNETRDSLGESTIDIYKYQQYYREGIVKEPIAHLFIVSDEFAELKAQQPDFMDELISAARIGRSLGVHLILATQKPTGVVNDQIWSNSKFKICLKVQNRSDSMEMLKKPDAASIKEAGRFYLQVGYDEFYDIGQSGWAGAKYTPTDRIIKKVDDSINFINDTGFIYKTINDLGKKESVVEQGDQLTNLVKYIISVAEKEKFEPKQLWQSTIPSEILLNDMKEKYGYKRVPFEINPPIGEYDNPSAQYQGLLTLDITSRGNTIIYGMAGSGKENLLSTIIYSTIIDHHPSEVNIYIIDLGAETLRIYEKMPHIGDVCLLNDGDKIYNLMVMIDGEVDRRKELFKEYNGSYINYCKNSGKTEPSIIVVINNMEQFVETYSKFAELLTPMYRDFNKYGVYFIITTSATNTIRSKIAELFNNKICLQLPNDTDYRTLLGAPRNLTPLKVIGRGIVALKEGQYEFQTAYIHTPAEINNIIKNTAEAFTQYNYKARRIPVLPDSVTLDLVTPEMKDLSCVPIGYDANKKEPFIYNFTKNKINVICTNDLDNQISFFYALIKLLQKDNNLTIRLVDAVNALNKNELEIECYQNDFDRIVGGIYKEIQTEANNQKNYLYIFVGIGELKNKLSDQFKQVFDILFTKSNTYQKSYFLVADNYSSYKKFQTEVWYNDVIDNKTGIWLGEGVSAQFALSLPKLTAEEKQITAPDVSFVANKGSHTLIKRLEMGERDGVDE